jgi:hypothetical protein
MSGRSCCNEIGIEFLKLSVDAFLELIAYLSGPLFSRRSTEQRATGKIQPKRG